MAVLFSVKLELGSENEVCKCSELHLLTLTLAGHGGNSVINHRQIRSVQQWVAFQRRK